VSARVINPAELGAPRGYSNGLVYEYGPILFVAGQVAWDSEQRIVSDDFVVQFACALANVMRVVHEAGGTAESIGRLTIYVTDTAEYTSDLRAVGAAYRDVMGRHFPTMSLVRVAGLLEPGAKVEIEATAVLSVLPTGKGD